MYRHPLSLYSSYFCNSIFLLILKKKQRLIYLSLLIGCYLLYYIDFDIRVFFPYLQYLTFLEYNLSSYSNSTEVVFGTLNGPQILRITTCLFFWIFIDRIFRKKYVFINVFENIHNIALYVSTFFFNKYDGRKNV